MKIAFILDAFSLGGIETVANNYINLLNNKGYEIDVYVMSKTKIEMKTYLPDGVKLYPINFDRRLCPELYSYGVMKWWWGKYAYAVIHPILTLGLKIMKLFYKREKYDVAIAFSGHINDLTFVTEEFVKAKQKVCWCHGTLLSYLAICDGYPKLYKKIDKIVTLSEQGIYDVYSGHNFLKKKKIENIYNPVLIDKDDLDYIHIKKLQESYKDYVLMIARVTAPKDHITAINAMVELHKRGLKKHIVFLGEGDKLEEIKKYSNEKGLSNYCHFEGNRKDVGDYIKASYINLLASFHEGLPTVMIEAMAMGKPCVMTNCDGGEVTSYGKYGFLTPVGDYSAIADACEKLYFDDNVYRKYCKLSEERYRDFEPGEIIQKFEVFLESSF